MRNLLLSSVTLLMVSAVSYANPFLPAHIHTYTPIELKPVSQNNGTRLAAVCFLGFGDCSSGGFDKGDSQYDINTAKQCKNEGFVNSCPSDYCMDGSCPYSPAYGKCLAENCPANSSPACTGAITGKTACGGDCKKCCSDTCPSGSKTYTGSYASATECGNSCYNCNTTCPSGSLSYSGAVVSHNECGQACKACSEACPSGTTETNPGGCGGSTQNECKTKTCFYPFVKCCTPTCPPVNCQEGQTYIRQGNDGCGGSCSACAWTIIGNYSKCSSIYETPWSFGSVRYCYTYRNMNILYNGSIVNGVGSESERCRTSYSAAKSDQVLVNCGVYRYF